MSDILVVKPLAARSILEKKSIRLSNRSFPRTQFLKPDNSIQTALGLYPLKKLKQSGTKIFHNIGIIPQSTRINCCKSSQAICSCEANQSRESLYIV